MTQRASFRRLLQLIGSLTLAILLTIILFGCSSGGNQTNGTQPISASSRPSEKVTPAPAINADAVIWRTNEPPQSHQAGDVWANPKDGMELVFVPEGDFTLGTSQEEIAAWTKSHLKDLPAYFANQQPQCKVKLNGFWLGRTEVTHVQYAKFLQATGYPAPPVWEGGAIPAGLENKPVVMITWDDARSYCDWAGGRLPREIEWEKAARGTDGRTFPWGNDWDKSRCANFSLITGKDFADESQSMVAMMQWMNQHDPQKEGLKEAGSYPQGASPYGCLDMVGNVSEWCVDWYAPTIYRSYAKGDLTPISAGKERVVRSECYFGGVPNRFRCATRISMIPTEPSATLGFRVARSQ